MSVERGSVQSCGITLGILMLIVTGPFLTSRPTLAQERRDVDICELFAHPDQFSKKQIRVRARLETVVIEGGMWLFGDLCPKDGIMLSVPEAIRRHPEEHPDYAALRDAILNRGNVGTVGKSITATFSGEFVYDRRKKPKRTLLLEKIENLETRKSAE